jgi:hypothetical protein
MGTEAIAAAVVGAIVIAIPSPPTTRPDTMPPHDDSVPSVPKRGADSPILVM